MIFILQNIITIFTAKKTKCANKKSSYAMIDFQKKKMSWILGHSSTNLSHKVKEVFKRICKV